MTSRRLFSRGLRILQQQQQQQQHTPLLTTINLNQLKQQTSVEPMYLYALPLTTHKTFIYCKHTNDIFPNGKETIEMKMIGKFQKAWSQFGNSQMKINQRIVKFVNGLLSKIPYMENCLLSIPSQKYMRRFNIKEGAYIMDTEAQAKGLTQQDLKHFNFYYPNELTTPMHILDDLRPDIKSQYEDHKKSMIRDILLMPLTIPLVMIPLVPNVPGFYLVYRIYCHMKVMASVKHFITLMKGGHLDMIKVNDLTTLYLKTEDLDIRRAVESQINRIELGIEDEAGEEQLLGYDVIDEISNAMGDPQVRHQLKVALDQVHHTRGSN